jgi:hypothetical protein
MKKNDTKNRFAFPSPTQKGGNVMKRILILTLIGCFAFATQALALTADEARDIYIERECLIQYTACDQVCYKCNSYCPLDDGVNVPVDPEVFLYYGQFKDQLPQPQPQPDPACSTDPVDPPVGGNVQGDDGKVAIVATNFDANIPYETHAWVNVNGYMTASPDSGFRIDPDGLAVELQYNITFVKSGVHYLWLEGAPTGASSDSVHYGLDGVYAGDLTFLNKTWSSEQQTASGQRAIISVTAGDHVLNIWMREDGSNFRNVEIVTDEAYTP